MSGDSMKIWRCTACSRLLVERSVDYVRERHAGLVSRCGSVDFVREATWGAYLAALKRCRCGSKRALRPMPPKAVRGQLDFQLEPVVLQ